ncbi:hypothetical protein [Henriciella sp.]|uniref:hypothetical protein n=1 Tax=Henriciella sp. TaxID=1968823 RepID=UPI00262647AD|nr:hypothetical protein [Henriciella sp.]
MRHLCLSLAALSLAACGGGDVDPDARMPEPHPEGSDGSTVELTEYENSIGSTEASGDAMEGTWSSADIDGNSAVAFEDAEENRQLAVICREGGEDQSNSITLRRYVDEDEVGENTAIAVFTSAGNKSYQATGAPADVTTPMDDYFATMMGAARGEIRVVVGEDIIIVPASEAVSELVSDCRPEMEYQGPESEEEDEEGDEEESEDDAE